MTKVCQNRGYYEKKRLFLFSFCLILSVNAFLVKAQHNSIEANGGKIFVPGDTAHINRLINHAFLLRETFADSAVLLYRHAHSVSRKINYRNGIAKSLQGIGRYYNYINQKETSLHYLRTALPYCENNMSGHELTASIYISLSENFYYMGRYDSCAWYRYEALNELENHAIENPEMQLKVYGRLLQFWLNAHGDIVNDPYILQLEMHINSLERVAIAAKDSNLLEEVYFQKAGYYNSIKQNDSARYYCNLNLVLGRRLGSGPSMRMATLVNIGITYLDDKQPGVAIKYFNKVVEAAPLTNQGTNRYLLFNQIFLGKAFCMQKQYQKAISIIEQAIGKARQLNIISITDEAHKALADAYEAIGQYQKATENQRLYSAVRDSLMKAERLELVYNVEMKYRIAEKNKELAQKELAIVHQESSLKTKNIWIGGITAGLILITLLSVLLYSTDRHKQKLQAEKILSMQQDMEINRLKAMISGEDKERNRIAKDLHDGIGGTLGSIRGQLSMIFRKYKTSDVDKDFIELMSLLEEASLELRKTAHNLMPEILLRQGLTKATRIFCDRITTGSSVAIGFETWGDERILSPDFELTVYRIIQELVHNIIKHAGAREATVQLIFHDTQLCLTVEDNGKGMCKEETQRSAGMGIETIKQRVRSLDGQLDIESTTGRGTSVYIEFNIPAKKDIKETCL